jgi:hypothetical protein
VLKEVGRNDVCDGIAGTCKGLVARYSHKGDAALHDAVELYEEGWEHLAEMGVGPEEVTGCVEPILSEANLGPEDITIRGVHASEILLGVGRDRLCRLNVET